MSVRVEHGDSREVLKSIPDCSVDSVVTDTPYALVSIVKRFGKEGAAPAQEGRDGLYRRASKGFMNKTWDTGETAHDPAFWREVLRVLKPGGHLIAFGGTRTSHRMVAAIEDAGFEIRDEISNLIASDGPVQQFLASLNQPQVEAFFRCVEESGFGGRLEWVFGSGFPKSHDVSKGIDKARDDYADICRVALWLRPHLERAGFAKVSAHFGFKDETMVRARWTSKSQPNVPRWEQWIELKALCEFGDEMDAEVWRLNGRKGEPGAAWADREFYDEPTGGLHGGSGNTVGAFGKGRQAKPGGVTAAAIEWQGWGTALKPAHEPICLARKPLSGTVAETVLQHGTGGLNIDGCRVPTDDAWLPSTRQASDSIGTFKTGERTTEQNSLGRWPANVILSYPRDEYEIRAGATQEQKRAVYRWLSENA